MSSPEWYAALILGYLAGLSAGWLDRQLTEWGRRAIILAWAGCLTVAGLILALLRR